jgi:hypothetical protein
MQNDLEKIVKEMVVAYFKVLFRESHEVLRKSTKKLNQHMVPSVDIRNGFLPNGIHTSYRFVRTFCIVCIANLYQYVKDIL